VEGLMPQDQIVTEGSGLIIDGSILVISKANSAP
jgi:hypothetical protein